eukprot:EG_transcript_60619
MTVHILSCIISFTHENVKLHFYHDGDTAPMWYCHRTIVAVLGCGGPSRVCPTPSTIPGAHQKCTWCRCVLSDLAFLLPCSFRTECKAYKWANALSVNVNERHDVPGSSTTAT